MDSVDALLLMRMVERLLGLLSGALCVLLGYRLFINLPEKTDSAGKVVLPGGVSIWLSRVGPGIFFALFGAAIVAYSFASTVRVTNEQNVPRASSDTPGEALAMRRQEIAAMSPRAAQAAAGEKALIELRGALADLNATIDKLTRDAAPPERDRLIAGLQNAKMLLLRGAWQPTWGDPARFQSWINSGAVLPAPAGMDEPAGLYLAARHDEGVVMRAILALLFLLGGLNAAHAQCAPPFNWSGFYPPAALDRVAQRTTPGLRSNFEQVLLPRLTDRERQRLGGITLDLSRREYAEHPLNFYAATGGKVVLPLSSVKLVSDLSLALAWYNRSRLPEQKVFDYAAMLAFRGPAPDGVKALPLAALGVPDAADNDPAVEGLFQKLFGTTMVFIMAHETGHLFHGHRANVGEARSRQQEGEADAFAVEMMARMGAPPIGISFYFMMAAPFECAERSTHPLSGERITRLVAALRDNAALFARDKPSPQQERQLVESIAQELGKVAKLVDDPDIRESMRLAGLSSKVADFAAATRPSGTRPGANRQPFDGDYVGQWTDAKGVSLDFRMSLRRQGTTVRGTYEFGMGTAELEGTIAADQLDYAWRWGTEYFGRGKMNSLANGGLQGTWGYTRRSEGGGTLSATPR